MKFPPNTLLRVPASLGLALLACATPTLTQEAEQEEAVIEAIRVATERFKDVNVALEEGYIEDPSGACTNAEMEGRPADSGAMGIQYFRPARAPVWQLTGGRLYFRNIPELLGNAGRGEGGP